MGLKLHYTVNGDTEVVHDLLRFEERLLEPEPILAGIADIYRGITKDRFKSEGPGWAALAASTLEQKEGPGIGVETGAMFSSLTRKGAEGSLEEIIGNTLHFGTNLTDEEGFPYPVIFDEGRKDGKQPKRPIFDIGAPELELLTKAVQAYMISAMRAEGMGGAKGDGIPGSDVMPSYDSQIYADF